MFTISGRDFTGGKDDMRRMQEDAVRRVREMQNRARGHLEAPSPRNQKKEPEPELRETTVQETHIAETALSPLETLMHDHERTLVLALLILLGSEKTNTELLFALLYLLL